MFQSIRIFFTIFALLSVLPVHADELFSIYNRESAGFSRDLITNGSEYVKNKVLALNEKALATIRVPTINRFPNRIEFVPKALALSIYRSVVSNPVANLAQYSKYDPNDQGIGFCFGRAMTVHLESIYQGVSRDSIKKIWALGSLQSGTIKWRYHVTSIVKGDNGVWFAIDPIKGRVLTVDEWYSSMKGMDSNNQMRLYVTEAEKFGPSNNKYHTSSILDPYYNNYFVDLMAYYRNLYGEM